MQVSSAAQIIVSIIDIFRQNITKGQWDKSRCEITSLGLNQNENISSGNTRGEGKLGKEKRKSKESFQKTFLYSLDLFSTAPAQELIWEPFRFRWQLESCWMTRFEPNLASLVLTASARLLPKDAAPATHEPRSRRGASCQHAYHSTGRTGETISGGPWAIKSQLLTFPRPAYQSAALS